jgi:predicted nucleic acid-binding protein
LELADTSAWTNRHKSQRVDEDFQTRVLADEIATCPIVVMELLWTAQTGGEFEELRLDLEALPQLPIDQETWNRATDVWHELVVAHQHREVKIPDLLVAAAAEIAGVAVCHYERDFEAISEITGQPVRAIAPIGSL